MACPNACGTYPLHTWNPSQFSFFPVSRCSKYYATACNCSTSFSEKLSFFGYHETKWPYANHNDHWRHYELWPPQPWVKDPTKALQRFTTCPEFTKTTTHLTVEAQQQDNLNTNSSAQEKIRKIYIYTSISSELVNCIDWPKIASRFYAPNNQMSLLLLSSVCFEFTQFLCFSKGGPSSASLVQKTGFPKSSCTWSCSHWKIIYHIIYIVRCYFLFGLDSRLMLMQLA